MIFKAHEELQLKRGRVQKPHSEVAVVANLTPTRNNIGLQTESFREALG
jgi:hypothetical protein